MNLRNLAEGQPCDLRAPGVCNGKPETTVLAHIKCGWFGSLKPPDLCAIRACSDCHDLIDGRRKFNEYTRQEIDAMILPALIQRLADYSKKRIVRW